MKVLFLVLQMAFSASQNPLFVFGPKTPKNLKSFYSEFPSLTLISLQEPSLDFVQPPFLIIDASLDPSLLGIIDSIAARFDSPYLSLSRPSKTENSSSRFFAFPSISGEAESLIKVINSLNWNDFTVFLSNSMQNLLTLDLIRTHFSSFQIKSYVYDIEIVEDQLDSLVKRYIKVKGEHNLLVLDQGSSLDLLVKLLIKRKIGKYGKYFLFGHSCINPPSLEGSLSLVYLEGLNSSSSDEFYIKVLSNFINTFQKFNKAGLDQRCPGQVCFSEQFIVNKRNGQNLVVGTVGKSVNITKQIVYPGNNFETNSGFKKTYLPVMIANGTREPNDIGNSELTSRFYYGALHAVEQANAELEQFQYQLIPTDCGNTKMNITWTIGCLSSFASTNSLAYISGYWPVSALSNVLAFEAFNRFLPQISPACFSDELNNKTTYPELIKLAGRLYEFTENTIFLYRFYNWKKVFCIGASDDVWKGYVNYVLGIMKRMGISCVNPEEHRYLPGNYTRDDFEKYKHIFEYAKNSRCRNIIMITYETGVIIEGFYDIGLRKGDLIFSGYIETYAALFENIDEKYLRKRKELYNGALINNQVQYSGKYGKKVERELKSKYRNVVNMCVTYDAFKTINNSIMYLAEKGEDYEDPHLLMKVMRNQKFVGCSGEVYFIPGENSRDNAWVEVSQIIVDPETYEVDLRQISAFNKFAMIVAKEINEPIWATGEKTVPSNFRPLKICVYEKSPQKSKNGKLSLHIVSLIYLVLVIIAAILSYKRFHCSVPQLTENVHPTFSDVIHQLFIVFELFQTLSLEPPDGLFSKSTKKLNIKLGLDIISAFDFKSEDFWNFYTLLLVFCGVWSVLASLSVLIQKEVLHSNNYLVALKFLSGSIIPVVGHLCFLPLSLMLMSIYKCEEGLSDDLFDSFIYRDCTEFCYRGRHRQVLIVSTFIIAIFFSVSTYSRPYWELSQDDQHLRTKVSYLSVLTVFQFVLLLVRVNFEDTDKLTQSFLLFGILTCFSLVTARMKPFNYEKMNIFQVTVLILCSWNMIITSIFFLLDYENQLKIVLFIGMGLIFGFGYKISNRYQNKFISDNSFAIPVLIKFQFSRDLSQTMKQNSFYSSIEKKISPERNQPV